MSTSNTQLKRRGKHVCTLLAVSLAVTMALNLTSLEIPSNVFLPKAYAQGAITETVRRRNLVIDLGDGLKTDAQLTLPIVGDGPFPGVFLIHGSGNMDMDEYLPPIASGTDEPTVLFLQIAEYLSSRGFAVLRYNKRGVGSKGLILDGNAWGNTTVQDLVHDAEKALGALRQQPEVDSSKISIIGHSEGTMIAPRIAVKDPAIASIVLMGACAQNLHEVLYFQIVERPATCAGDTFDADHDGLLSLQEVEATINRENINQCPLPPLALIQNTTGEWGWCPGLDVNMDGYFDIENELKPLQTAMFDIYTSSDPESPYYWIWLQSHIALNDTALDLIGDVSASVLILQGEADTQTTIEQAFLLEQKLTEVEHVDHTLITYPGLGHTFYPADGWIQPLGPMQDKVLTDLHAWLTSPARTVRGLEAQIQADAITIESLQKQLGEASKEIRSIQTQLTNELQASNTIISELQSSLSTHATITYIALIIATIAVIGTILTRAGSPQK